MAPDQALMWMAAQMYMVGYVFGVGSVLLVLYIMKKLCTPDPINVYTFKDISQQDLGTVCNEEDWEIEK